MRYYHEYKYLKSIFKQLRVVLDLFGPFENIGEKGLHLHGCH